MNRIKSIKICGFKKFDNLTINFNKHLNILVGGNEAGKSTVLEAVQVVLNQNYKNTDRTVLKELFNLQQVEEFKSNPIIKNLPEITIEVELDLDSSIPSTSYFYGVDTLLYSKNEERFGIRFSCRLNLDEEFGAHELISQNNIPYEFYTLEWKTFAGRLYQARNSPVKLLSIDTSRGNTVYSFNYFNKTIFNNKYSDKLKSKVKHQFNSDVEKVFENLGLDPISENRTFGIDPKKLILENIISICDEGIPLENHGRGMENLIKTQIALERANNTDLILLEEPENHLGFSELRRMISDISKKKDESQIILATHSSMISSGLDLKNLIWIKDREVGSLLNLSQDDADFFMRSPDNSVLQLLLSKRVLLVEGAAEYILAPIIYQKQFNSTLEGDKITVISCNGLSFERYLAVASESDIRVAIITDNDRSRDKIDEISKFNSKHTNQRYFIDDDLNNWTFEVCMYHLNAELFDSLIKVVKGAEYKYHGEQPETPVLGKMLNNKADTAYKLIQANRSFSVPKYILEAFKWLNE